MDILLISAFLFVLLFGLLSGTQDLRERKVSNKLTVSLFIVSLLLFVYSFLAFDFELIDIVLLILTCLLAYLLYAYHYWGAADGKLFIALSLIVLSFGRSPAWAAFVLILLFSYSLALIASVFLFTKEKEWKAVLRGIHFVDEFLVLAFFFSLFSYFFSFFTFNPSPYAFVFSLVVAFGLSSLFTNTLKYYLAKIPLSLKVLLSMVFLASLYYFTTQFELLLFFAFLYIVRLFILWIGDLSGLMHDGKKRFYTPFSLYLFFSALLTLGLFPFF